MCLRHRGRSAKTFIGHHLKGTGHHKAISVEQHLDVVERLTMDCLQAPVWELAGLLLVLEVSWEDYA